MIRLLAIADERLQSYRDRVHGFATSMSAVSNDFNPWKHYFEQETAIAQILVDAKTARKRIIDGIFSSKEDGAIYKLELDLEKSERYLSVIESRFNRRLREIKDYFEKVKLVEKKDKNKKELAENYYSNSNSEFNLITSDIDDIKKIQNKIISVKDTLESIKELNSRYDANSEINLETRLELIGVLAENAKTVGYTYVRSYFSELENKINEIDDKRVSVGRQIGVYSVVRKGVLALLASVFTSTGFSPHVGAGSYIELENVQPKKTEVKINTVKENIQKDYNISRLAGKSKPVIAASTFYADSFEGKKTYSEIPFSQSKVSCAVPYGSELMPKRKKDGSYDIAVLKITNVNTGDSIVAIANDVGNFGKDSKKLGIYSDKNYNKYSHTKVNKEELERGLDLSKAAARRIGGIDNHKIKYELLGWTNYKDGVPSDTLQLSANNFLNK